MCGDRGAQRRGAGGVAVMGEPDRAAVRQRALQQPPPGLEREEAGARLAGKEVERQTTAVAIDQIGRAQRAQRRGARGAGVVERLGGDRRRRERVVRQARGDEHAGGGSRIEIAFRDQAVVGAHHRVARDRELLGQVARRRQPRRGGNAAAADRLAQLLDELAGQRFRSRSVEQQGDLHRGSREGVAGRAPPDGAI